MELTRLITELSPHAAEVRQTHISVVFLTDTLVYKIKKPVNLGFLDFSTLAKRKHYCNEEVRLNRRLAGDVYHGVVPVVETPAGLRFEAEGEAVEWAVKMTRLPEAATLQRRLLADDIDEGLIDTVARRIAQFHASAERGPRIAKFGHFDVVAGNARDNFTQAQPLVGTTVSQSVFDRLQRLTEAELDRLRPAIADRIACDTHGDLHLDHVYCFPDRPPPADLAIIDCIEFSERFRYADPVSDMAFLAMDLRFHGRPDLADRFAATYFAAAADAAGRELLPFYTAYRAGVRGKVEGMKQAESEVPAADRDRALTKARAYWLLALGQLEAPERRPGLLLIGGLPGSGKSTLARGLADAAGFQVLRSDVVRKELAGNESGSIYTPEWTERTYAECLRRAETLLFEGQRVLIDASFRAEAQRGVFLDAAVRWGVPPQLLICQAADAVIQQRLRDRRHDASDADWTVHQQLAKQWQEVSAATRRVTRWIDTDGLPAEIVAHALRVV